MNRRSLLIVDDEKEIIKNLVLTFEDDYEVFTASDGAEALEILAKNDIALVITDQRMPQMTGVEFLERSILVNPQMIRIVLTGYTDTQSLIQAINQGRIYQCVTKPWNRQELKMIVQRALENYELTLENKALFKALQAANDRLKDENAFLRREMSKEAQNYEIVGDSLAMRQVLDFAHKVTHHTATVLLTGETGTGKTLLARYIHYNGSRQDKLFVEQNCGTLPEELLESELFGHRRGAFTGASHDRKGLFEVADGGTLFLDEISEMSPALQVKLLQVLQEGQFRRVGESELQKVDVRIIAATNRDLPAEIKRGHFRADLYYRINVFPIHIPPLREHIEDIPLLVENCLKKYSRKMHHPVANFSEETIKELCRYEYPGNVRELENLIERALILNKGLLIESGEWLPVLSVNLNNMSTVEQFERAEIIRLIEAHQGNLGKIAKELKVSRTTLWRRIKDYQLQSHLDSLAQNEA